MKKITRDPANAIKNLPAMRNRSGVISEFLPWLLIGLAVLAILMISIFLLKGQGTSFIDAIKNIFKSG